ncbi:MAG: NTP transferase domain-containing protein [Fidelibacterota bacterium]
MMVAVILAAGVARRLYPLTYDRPKCLLEVGEKPIIDYQLEALQSLGVSHVVLVVGYFREMVVAHAEHSFPEMTFSVITNDHFFETNTAYSLYLCRETIRESDILLMNADVLFPESLIQRVLHSPASNVLAVEPKPCGREEVKVIAGDGDRIVAIGKELIQENSLGEFIGVAKFSRSFNGKLSQSLTDLVEAGGKADYFEAAVHPLLATSNVSYVDISDLPSIEIDFLEDLERARELVQKSPYR